MESHQIHSHAKEKHFKHYLFEFFMLFLAVFLGFIAENIREHSVEIGREKEYVKSIIEDIKLDINQLDSLNNLRLKKREMIDSILFILDTFQPDQYGNQLYYFARCLPRPIRIISNDGTMQQLKNAGNLRLIRNKKCLDAILKYDQLVRYNIIVEDREETLIQQTYPSLKKIFNPRVFEKMVNGMQISRPEGDPILLHSDSDNLNEFYSHVHFLKNVNSFNMEFSNRRLNMAKHTLNVLQKEYNLQ